jgi:uncharacterized protein YbcI
VSLEDPPGVGDVKRELAREIARVHVESYGERALNLRVAVEDDVVAVMMDIEFNQAERTLLHAGRPDAIQVSREAYQEAIADVYIAIVERATSRRVVGFASRTVVDDPVPWSVEIFRLDPPLPVG